MSVQVWTSLNMFEQDWTNLVHLDPISSILNKFDQVWSSLIKFEQVWTNSFHLDPIWSNLNMFEQVWTIQYIWIQFHQVWTSLNQFNPFWSNSINFDQVWTRSGLNKFDQVWTTCFKIAQKCSMDDNNNDYEKLFLRPWAKLYSRSKINILAAK